MKSSRLADSAAPPAAWARLVLLTAVALLVAGLLVVQFVEGQRTHGRMIGISLDQLDGRLLVERVTPGRPAAAAGLEAGDVVLEVAGLPATTYLEYDRAALGFVPGQPVAFRVLRDSGMRTLEVRPGIPFPWGTYSVNVLAALLHLALGALAVQRARDRRAALLTLLSLAVAVELALPTDLIAGPLLTLGATFLFAALTGLEIGVELHLASVIPERQRWLRRRSLVIPLYYAAGLLLSLPLIGSAVGAAAGWQLPWSLDQADTLLFEIGLPLWALGAVVLLSNAALRWPYPLGRQQAALVLVGVMPWALLTLGGTLLELAGRTASPFLEAAEPLALLCYPVAVFVAIFRYQLFDIELAVRRGLVYSALSTALLLVFYGALGAGGALFSRLVDAEAGSVWILATATLVLGLIFSPLRRRLDQFVERRFFPERAALRQRLGKLAGELPALGKLPAMGQELVGELRRIFAIRSASLLLADRSSGLLVTLASSAAPEPAQSLLVSPRDAAVEALKAAKRPFLARHLTERTSPLAERLSSLDLELVVPILHQEQLVGILLLGRKAGGGLFPAEEMELLDLFSRHVAIVFENARLFESATQDSLTGLLRREAILEQLRREVERAVRYNRPLTIGMADLDNFKQINDRHGHLAGDLMLKRVSEVLARTIRNTDLLGRYGGEEFLILLPETDLPGALQVADKLRREVARLRVEIQGGETLSITTSIGLATLDHSSFQMPEELIAAADRWLYRAKNAGRNRVEPMAALG